MLISILKQLLEQEFVRRACAAVIILCVGVLLRRVLMGVVDRALARSRLEKAAHSLIRSLLSVSVYILLGLITASTLGIDVTSVVALASVLTLALSLALQNMVSNIIGGFTILYTHPFRSGDYVQIADQSGTVTEINMSYTMLSTPDNKLISIPNSAVVAAEIVNYSTAETRRIETAVWVDAAVPAQTVLDALIQAGTVDNVLLDPAPMAVIAEYGESGVRYSLRLWVRNADYWDVTFAVNRRLKDIFDSQGIPLSYPNRVVRLPSEKLQ